MAVIEGTRGTTPVTRVTPTQRPQSVSPTRSPGQPQDPSSTAADARAHVVQQEFEARQDALSVLDRDFLVFDTAAEGGDGDDEVSREDIEAVARGGTLDNGTRVTTEQQEAAQYLLDHDDVFARLDVADDGGGYGSPDDTISRDDLNVVLEQQPLFEDAGTFISDEPARPGDVTPRVATDASPEEAAADVAMTFNPTAFGSHVREHADDPTWLRGFFRALGAQETANQLNMIAETGSDEGVQAVQDALADMYADGTLTGQDVARLVEHWAMYSGDFPEAIGDLFAGLDGTAGRGLQTEFFRATSQLSRAGEADAPTGPFAFSAEAVDRLSDGDRESLAQIGARAFIPEDTQENVERFLEFSEELNWRIANLGPAMTPEQLEAAIEGFMEEKGEEWQQEFEALQQAVVDDGVELLEALGSDDLDHLSDAERSALVEALVNDPEGELAVNMALTAGAEQLDADTLDRALGFFEGVSLAGKGASLFNSLGSAYIRNVALDRVMDVDPNDPQSIRDARAGIEELRGSNLARALGVSETQFNEVVDALEATLPDPDGPRMTSNEVYERLEALDDAIGDLQSGSSGRADQLGSALRLLGVGAGAVSLYSDVDSLIDDPNLENSLRTAASAAGLSRDVTELLVQSGRISPDSAGGRVAGSRALGKALGAVGLAFGTLDLARNIGDGDYAQAGLTAVGLGGAALATFGTTSWAGPVGIAVGLLAAGGSLGLNQYRRVQESNKYMNDTSAQFLEHAGFDPDVAQALVDQSGEGYSPVPILMEYGRAKGMTPSETVEWINGLSSSELSHLRDTLHHTLDDIDGDLAELPETADSDADYVEQIAMFSGAQIAPHSVAQVDAFLAVNDIALPA